MISKETFLKQGAPVLKPEVKNQIDMISKNSLLNPDKKEECAIIAHSS